MKNQIKLPSSLSLAVLLFTSVSARAQSGPWQTVSNDPPCTPRDETSLVALDGKLYLLGGRGIDPVEEYDPSAKAWRKLAPPPLELHHFQALAVDGRILVPAAMTGSFPKETVVPNLWWFDPKKNEWTKGVEIPASRRRGSAGAALRENKLYLVCGITNGHWNGFVSWVDMLDLKSGQWTILPDAPHARDHFNAVLAEGKIVAASGGTSYGEIGKVDDLTVPEVDLFDLATRQWTTLANPIPTQRTGGMAVGRDGKVVIIGGQSMSQLPAHREVEALSLATGKWAALPALSQGTHGAGAAFIGDTLYVVSGVGNRGGAPRLNSMQTLHWPVDAGGAAKNASAAPILAEWDFPIIEGSASPTQTSGEFSLGTFTGFFADVATDPGGGIVAQGTSWPDSDSAIGIILRFKTPADFSAVTSITFTVRVDNPPTENPGIQAYVQNGPDEQYAGDYNFFARPPLSEFATFTYKINPRAKGLDIKKITTFRIKVNGPPTSVNRSAPGGKYPALHVKKIIMQ